jgi:hypothetical protein
MTPPFDYRDYASVRVGVDETNGRFADVTIETCRSCARKWLRYHVEFEHLSRSGRWYRGLLTDAAARAVTPETAVCVLEGLEWRFAGGSAFGSTGFRTTDPLRVDP